MSEIIKSGPILLDCTLRDGGYVIDFRFTKDEVRGITAALAESGISLIEIGHGLGLGAYRAKNDPLVLTDEAVLEAARQACGAAKVGMFFIPGVGNDEDIRGAAKGGMDFIRIGVNASECEKSYHYIELAKSCGLNVFLNFMKSYTVPKLKLLKSAKQIERVGVDAIYLVDSAGGMLPREIGEAIFMLRENLAVNIGFHGHNNLMLVNANNMAAIENGATYIDTTIMGMGRGGGNSSTESMIYILKRMGYESQIDAVKVLDCATAYIVEKLNGSYLSDIDIVSGFALFHSSFYDIFHRIANEVNVDVRELIIKVSEIDKACPASALVYSVAANLAKKNNSVGSPKSIVGVGNVG